MKPSAAFFPNLRRPPAGTAYRLLAPVYDGIFGAGFESGRREVVRALAVQPGESVLEVGVGTGLSLPGWARHARITGIDLSPEMLRRADRRRLRLRLDHVRLERMDGEAMGFPADSFDKVAVMYVLSGVADLGRLASELRRVCRADGRIAILNHFREPSDGGRGEPLGVLRRLLGFRPAVPREEIVGEGRGIVPLEIRPVGPLGYWTLVLARPVK